MEIPPQPTVPLEIQGMEPPQGGEMPENMPVPQFPQGGEGQMPMPERPAGGTPPQGGMQQPVQVITGVLSTDFAVVQGANYFTNVRTVTE